MKSQHQNVNVQKKELARMRLDHWRGNARRKGTKKRNKNWPVARSGDNESIHQWCWGTDVYFNSGYKSAPSKNTIDGLLVELQRYRTTESFKLFQLYDFLIIKKLTFCIRFFHIQISFKYFL